MHKVNGGCHCGNLLVELELTKVPSAYFPRACDCDFCRKHGASYVSDPQGSLIIRIKDEHESRHYRQGSGAADCLLCQNCGVLVAVLYRSAGPVYGAVNARVLDVLAKFGEAVPVSPQTLSDHAKVQRWQEIWFPNVSVVGV